MASRGVVVQDSQVTMSQLMLPSDANPHGSVHGGTVLRLIDNAAGVAEMALQSQEISDSTRQIAEGAEHTHLEMEGMASVVGETSAVTENASAAAQQTSASSQQVAASADMLARTAEELRALVGAFRLSEAA